MVNGILRNKRLPVLNLFFYGIYVINGMVECLGCPVIICYHYFEYNSISNFSFTTVRLASNLKSSIFVIFMYEISFVLEMP